MHYCFLYFSKELPTLKEIVDTMEPFKDETNFDVFYWDWFTIGGRYGGGLKLKVERENEIYRWEYVQPREGRLFYCSLIKRLMEVRDVAADFYIEDDSYDYLGYRDGFLRVDSAPLKDLVNFDELGCYAYVGVNGELHVREILDEKECRFIKIEHFDEDLQLYIKQHMDCFVTILDVHS